MTADKTQKMREKLVLLRFQAVFWKDDTRRIYVQIKLSNHSNLQILPVNQDCVEVEAEYRAVDSENESWNLQRAQIIRAAVPTSRGPDQALFSLRGGKRQRERDIWKLSTECFLNGHFQNHGSKSVPCRENKLCYLTQEQSRAVIIKWLAQWVNSPAISSHSYAERSWLSLKWYLGSGIRNAPDWSRSRKLCLTWNRKSP